MEPGALGRRRRRGGAFSLARLFANGEAGGVYDPSDLTAEKVAWRRNLLTWSEDFTNAAWNAGTRVSVTANQTTAPDGTSTADLLASTTTFGGHILARNTFVSVTAGLQYTLAIYFKKGTGATAPDWMQLSFNSAVFGSLQYANYNITTISVGTVGGGASATIENAGSGWVRCTFTALATATSASGDINITFNNNSDSTGRAPSYSDVTTSDVFVWGAQVEVSPTATAYQRITDFTSDFLAAFPTHGLYQDSAGTTPVTALGQPVGLVIDSKTGGLASIGATVLANGDFASGASWTAGTGWSIAAGVATKTAGTASVLSQAVTLTIPGTYRLIYTMTRSAGTLTPRITGGTTVNATARSASGTYTEYVTTVTGNTTFEFSADASFAGTVDDVTLQLVPGVHAIQATSSSRPLLDGRVNLLTFSEQFDNAAWTRVGLLAFGSGSTANAAVAPDGTTTADLITETAALESHGVDASLAVGAAPHIFSLSIKYNGRQWVRIDPYGAASPGTDSVWYDVQNGVLGTQQANATGSISAQGNGWFRIAWQGTTTAGTFIPSLRFSTADNTTAAYTGDGTSGVFIWGADLRLATDAAYPYQRVAAATDYADVGVPRAFAFDGFDDSFYTASNMDLSGTDKVTVLVGVRKLSDAALGIVAELSASAGAANPGSFFMAAPRTAATGDFAFNSGGTAFGSGAISANVYPAPTTRVMTGSGNISGDSALLRIDGLQAASSTADQGTGNFGNYVLFIGRRNNASLPFNGKAYQLIVRGALTDAATLAQAERYVGAKTGLYI